MVIANLLAELCDSAVELSNVECVLEKYDGYKLCQLVLFAELLQQHDLTNQNTGSNPFSDKRGKCR